MNFYKHHIGDYDADTSHLTWDEDMAYTRMMRAYYRREKPLPADVKEVCRLVRATSKTQRDAVSTVLNEFFSLEADGWHQKRCDEEIGEANRKAEQNREVGKLGGRPRKARNPEETQTVSKQKPTENPDGFLSDSERDAEIHGNSCSEEKHSVRSGNEGFSKASFREEEKSIKSTLGDNRLGFQKEPNHNPSQTPDSRLQTPEEEPYPPQPESPAQPEAPEQPPNGSSASPVSRSIEIAVYLRQRGIVGANSANPNISAWGDDARVTNEILDAALSIVAARKLDKPAGPNYLAMIIPDLLAPKPAKPAVKADDWHRSEAGIKRKAKELGVAARSGESWDQLKGRVWDEVRTRERQGAAA